MKQRNRKCRIYKEPTTRVKDSSHSRMVFVLQILYALIYPILNLFLKFSLIYELKGKRKCILKTLFYSSVLVYGTWNVVCIYLTLSFLHEIIIDGLSDKTLLGILLLALLVWLFIRYNFIIYERHMKKLLKMKF